MGLIISNPNVRIILDYFLSLNIVALRSMTLLLGRQHGRSFHCNRPAPTPVVSFDDRRGPQCSSTRQATQRAPVRDGLLYTIIIF